MEQELTLRLLGLVTGERTDNGIFHSLDAITRTLDVVCSTSGIVLALSLGVFLFPRFLPRFGTDDVADL